MPTEALIITINEKGALQVKRNLEGIGKSAARSSKGVQLLKGALAGIATIGLGIVLVAGVKQLAAFGQEMATVKAIANATGKEFEELTQKATDLGTNTRFTATQAAEGMKFLARAGFNAAETLEAVDDTLLLAQAGALDLGTAARLTAQAVKGFRLDVREAAKVTDILALAANSSNTDVTQLGDALKFAAPAASGLNVSIEETVAAVQLLSDAGLQGTLAGTGLRRAFIALESPTKTQARIIEDLGLKTEDLKISSVGMTEVFRRLRDAGLDTGTSYKLFGQRAGAVGEILTQVIPELEENTEKLLAAEGTARRVADTMDATLNGALLRVKSAAQGVNLALGQLGADQGLTSFMNGLAAVIRFVANELDILLKVTGAVGVALLVAFGPRSLRLLATGIKALGTRITALWATMLANPLLALATGVAFLVTALVLLRNEINLFGDDFITLGTVMTATWNVIRGTSADATKELTEDATTIKSEFRFSFEETALFLLAMLQAFLQVLDKVIGTVIGTIAGIVGAVQKAVAVLKTGALPSFRDLGDAFAQEFTIGFGLTAFDDLFKDILTESDAVAAKKQRDAVAALRKEGEEARKTAQIKVKGPPEFVGPPAPPVVDPEQFAALLASLNQESDLLRLRNIEREIQEGLLEAEADLKFDLTGAEEQQVLALLRGNQAMSEQTALLDEIKGPQREYERALFNLNELQASGAITTVEFTKKQKELQEALGKTKDEATSLGDILKGAFSKASNALSSFINTGKASFSQLADSILADLARIAAQQAILQIFSGPLGFLPGFQGGGGFMVGGAGGADSKLVSFMATPGEQVSVTPPGQQAAPQAAAPNITIVNVTDPSEIPEVMGGAEGEQIIINTIMRNRNTVRQGIA